MMGAETPPTIASARRALASAFTGVGIESADIDARLLIAHALDIDRTTLFTHGHRVLTAEDLNKIERLSARRLAREPVAYIVGYKEFWSLSLKVTPDVLVPRPETETLVELILDAVVGADALRLETLRILDIGTGSGALLLALLSELENATGTGTDISPAALEIARANAGRNGLADRCTFVACDIVTGLSDPFDIIVSNPPYIAHGDLATLPPEVRDHEPAAALDGGNDGLAIYRAIAQQAPALLEPGGQLVVELGIGQEPAVRALFAKAGLAKPTVRNDLAGIPRALATTAP